MLLALIAGLIWFQIPYKEESIVDRYSLVCIYLLYYLRYESYFLLSCMPISVNEKDGPNPTLWLVSCARRRWCKATCSCNLARCVVLQQNMVLFLRKLGQYATILKTRVINYMYPYYMPSLNLHPYHLFQALSRFNCRPHDKDTDFKIATADGHLCLELSLSCCPDLFFPVL